LNKVAVASVASEAIACRRVINADVFLSISLLIAPGLLRFNYPIGV